MNTFKNIKNKRPGENFLGVYLGLYGVPFQPDGVLDLADHLENQASFLDTQADEARAAAELLRSGALVRTVPQGGPTDGNETPTSVPCAIQMLNALGVSRPPEHVRGLGGEDLQYTAMDVQQDDEDFIRLCIPDRVNGTSITLVINPTSWAQSVPIASFFKQLAKLTLSIGAWREWKALCPICEQAMSDFLAEDVSNCAEIPHPGRPCPACAEAMGLASFQTNRPEIQWNGQTDSVPGDTKPIEADQQAGE